jgi:hypothetical protein
LNHDRRVVILIIWLAIAAGCAALGEVVYLLLRWAGL